MSGCTVGPYVQAYDPPVSCAIELYYRASDIAAPPLQAVATHNGTQVDVTGALEDLGALNLDMAIYTVDCNGQPVSETHTMEPYHHFRISLATSAQPGDTVTIGGSYAGTIQPAVSVCPEPPPMPMPSCSGNYDGCAGWADAGVWGDDVYEPHDDGGCNAGRGSAGLLVSLAIFAVSRRRRIS